MTFTAEFNDCATRNNVSTSTTNFKTFRGRFTIPYLKQDNTKYLSCYGCVNINGHNYVFTSFLICTRILHKTVLFLPESFASAVMIGYNGEYLANT